MTTINLQQQIYDNKRHRVATAALDGRSNIETEALIVFGVRDGVFTPH